VLEETFERFYAIPPAAKIAINNGDGAVLLYGSDGNDMRVRAVKKAYSRERLSQIAIEISVRPNVVSVRTKFAPQPKCALFDRSGTVDYAIVVPATAEISTLRLNAGEVIVDGMRGRSVHAWLGDGRMFAHNCFANVDLALQRGNLAISYDWWEQGTFLVHANIARGDAWAFLPSDAAFHLVAEAVHGKLASDFENTPGARAASAGARKIETFVHGGGQASINVRAANGDIKIVATHP